MRRNNKSEIQTVEAPVMAPVQENPEVDATPRRRPVRSRRTVKKVDAEPAQEVAAQTAQEVAPVENLEKAETKAESVENVKAEAKVEVTENKVESLEIREKRPLPRIATGLVINDFCDLANNGGRIPLLNDQQIQQLTLDEAVDRCKAIEQILYKVLNYDIVLSDTNIWLELLVGHTSSHSDPKVNARLQFERQLEFISKMMKRIGGKFMVMSETYEEIDRFASTQEPTNYKDADWTDEVLCRNVAARLAKRLMLSQQKENRLRIEGIGSESHHAAFADPAIIRRTVELFAQGRRVLLMTNDASVGIRSLGMCDDLQRVNNIDDKSWRTIYEPQRPMVLTMDDLKLLDMYTRQYYYLMSAAGRQWMQDVNMREAVTLERPLDLWLDGFRPGDRHERRSDKIDQQRAEAAAKKAQAEQQAREAREQQMREQQAREQQAKEAREQKEQQMRELQAKQKQALQNRQKQEQKPVEKPAQQGPQQVQQFAQPQVNQQQKAEPVQQPTQQPAEIKSALVAKPVETKVIDNKNNAVDNKNNVVEVKSLETPEPEQPVSAEEFEAPIGSFGETAEMMDLIAPQGGEKKSRNRRGGRRRNFGNKKQGSSQE